MERVALYDTRLSVFEEKCKRFKDLPIQLKLLEYPMIAELATLLNEKVPSSVKSEYESCIWTLVELISDMKEIYTLASDLKKAIYEEDMHRMRDLIGALIVCAERVKSKLEK
jgi:hypothetical protein